jgi:hypothetical protein
MPIWARARWYNSTYGANRSGCPPMMARRRGIPCRAARTTDSGDPPTPIQVFREPDSVVGYTLWFTNGGRRLPAQVIGASFRTSENRSSFSSNSCSYWVSSKPKSGNDSVNEPRPRMISARPFDAASSVANRWKTRMGSSELSTVTADPSRMREVRPEIADSTISGEEIEKSAL